MRASLSGPAEPASSSGLVDPPPNQLPLAGHGTRSGGLSAGAEPLYHALVDVQDVLIGKGDVDGVRLARPSPQRELARVPDNGPSRAVGSAREVGGPVTGVALDSSAGVLALCYGGGSGVDGLSDPRLWCTVGCLASIQAAGVLSLRQRGKIG